MKRLNFSREKDKRDPATNDSRPQRPVDIEKIERYRKRYLTHDLSKRPLVIRGKHTGPEPLSRTPSPQAGLIETPSLWRVPQKVFFDLNSHIKKSFETGTWAWQDNNRLVISCPDYISEQTLIMSFLKGLDLGCKCGETWKP